jgi:hypothetical protein
LQNSLLLLLLQLPQQLTKLRLPISQQLTRRAKLKDVPLLQHQNFIRVDDSVEAVGDSNDGAVFELL